MSITCASHPPLIPHSNSEDPGDFSAWLDSGLYLTRDGDDRVLVVEHRSAPAPPPFRLRLVPGDTPHLVLQDALTAGAAVTRDPLQDRVLQRLRAAPRPHSTQTLRDVLRVRKADLLAALRDLADRHVIAKTDDGWTIIAGRAG